MSDELPTLERLMLQRSHETPDKSRTFGAISDEQGRRECVTLELGWHDNKENMSRIPAGEYIAERRWSPAHKCVVFGLLSVPDRKNIELHAGCLPRDTEGCVLLGTEYGAVDYNDGKPDGKGDGILGAKAAFRAFMANHPGQRIWLTVLDPSLSLPEHPL